MKMEFCRLGSVQDRFFAEAAALYKMSFPKYERRPQDRQAALFMNPLYHFDALTLCGVFVGILLYWDCSGYTYIEHFAIVPSARGTGIGSSALNAFYKEHPFVVLEIEPPAGELSARRECFYRRLGFFVNDYAHVHPAYREWFPPHRLTVMSYPRRITELEYTAFRRDLEKIVMRDIGIQA